MSFEESPTLDEYKGGLPDQLPDPSAQKRRVRFILGILLTIVFFLGGANFLQSDAGSLLMGTGAVRGKVVDAEGAPLQADVFVIGVEQIIRAAPDGTFLMEKIPAGEQSLVVANAKTGQEYPVRITAGQTLDIGQVQFVVAVTPGAGQ